MGSEVSQHSEQPAAPHNSAELTIAKAQESNQSVIDLMLSKFAYHESARSCMELAQLKHVLDTDFREACMKGNRADVWAHVQARLLSSNNDTIMCLNDLANRMLHGSSSDVEQFLNFNLKLPLGLKHNLIRLLRERCLDGAKRKPCAHATQSISDGLSRLLWEWKSGSVPLETFFTKLNEMVVHGEIDANGARKIIRSVLEDGGRSIDGVSLLIGRSQTSSCVGNVFEVERVYCGTQFAEVYTYSGEFVRIAPAQHTRSEIYYSTARCMSSTSSVLWEHVGDSDRLEFCLARERELRAGDACTADQYLTPPVQKPTLLIGDTIVMHEAVVDVHSVIMVDVLSAQSVHANVRFALLIEGSIAPGARFHLTHRFDTAAADDADIFDSNRDGETELNSPHSHAPGEASSADSNDEGNEHCLPPCSTDKRYLVIFATALDGVVVVECACVLRDLVLHDQIPTDIRLVAPVLAVLAGSNGLLAAIRAGAIRDAFDHGCGKQPAGRPPVYIAAGVRTSFSYFSLVQDDVLSEQDPQLPGLQRTHSGSVAITCMDATADDTDSVVLASGDAAGVVCLWSINALSGSGSLRAPPYHVLSEPRRVCSVHIASSGEHVAVGLLDRLLLLGLTRNEDGSEGCALYVRACLDVTGGTFAHYAVHFNVSFLRVWRITNEVRSATGPAASSRTELDSFPEVEASALSRTNSASALHEGLASASLDAEMMDTDGPAIAVGRRLDSPYNPQSPNPPQPLRRPGDGGRVSTGAYPPGVTVTTWLHVNVDEFGQRAGTSVAEHVARGNGTIPINASKSLDTGDIAIWKDVLSAESPSADGQRRPAAGGPGMLRSCSHDSANMSTYTSDGVQRPAATAGDRSARLSSPGGGELELQSNLSFPSSGVSTPHQTRYLLVNQEFLPLFAPEEEPVDAHPRTNAEMAVSEDSLLGDDAAGLTVSTAIPGVQVLMTDDAVSFHAANHSPVLASNLQRSSVHVRVPTLGMQRSSEEQRSDPAGLVGGVILDHRARNHSHYTAYGMERPRRTPRRPHLDQISLRALLQWFHHDSSDSFQRVRDILCILSACYQPPSVGIISAALEMPLLDVARLLRTDLAELLFLVSDDKRSPVTVRAQHKNLLKWMTSEHPSRVGKLFWVDAGVGHNLLCALYLRCCGNKSVAVEHTWQDYLRTYGPTHLRHATRGLRLLTANIRKVDETANIRTHLPRQIGYIVGLYEIYARRVGLRGRIPAELGQLRNLRVLSMGNNHLSGELPASLGELKNLQRIVLHQNNLRGPVPLPLGELGCIVNLAGNPLLHHGADVPVHERQALVDLYNSTRGATWHTKSFWCSEQPVAKWYKVGVLTSHVHSIVMSSNGMEGRLPSTVSQLTFLRMIELATMPGLVGPIPRELCSLTTLRRLCICRCGLTGRIPNEIGQLVGLEELQLFGNQLTGSVPHTLSCLTSLKLLSLGEYTGGNNFHSEPLPSCLSSLQNLEALFMANCNIRGPLPDWIGNLTELRQLDLQRNLLSGVLPASIGNLQNLLYLNIKDNEHLTGRLPLTQLLSLRKLNRLSLVKCNFVDTDAAMDALRLHLPRCKVWI